MKTIRLTDTSLLRAGLTVTELARNLGVDPSTVSGWKKYGVPMARRVAVQAQLSREWPPKVVCNEVAERPSVGEYPQCVFVPTPEDVEEAKELFLHSPQAWGYQEKGELELRELIKSAILAFQADVHADLRQRAVLKRKMNQAGKQEYLNGVAQAAASQLHGPSCIVEDSYRIGGVMHHTARVDVSQCDKPVWDLIVHAANSPTPQAAVPCPPLPITMPAAVLDNDELARMQRVISLQKTVIQGLIGERDKWQRIVEQLGGEPITMAELPSIIR